MYLSFSPHLIVLNSNIKVTLNEEYELRNSSLSNYLHSSVTLFPLALLPGTACISERRDADDRTSRLAVLFIVYYVVRFWEGRSERMLTLRVPSEIKNPVTSRVQPSFNAGANYWRITNLSTSQSKINCDVIVNNTVHGISINRE
jgi:hypothetical protein